MACTSRLRYVTITAQEIRPLEASSTRHADRSRSRYPAARRCTSGWLAEVRSPTTFWSVPGFCRECFLAELEEAIAEEHPELKRGDVFELVQEWLRLEDDRKH